MDIGIALSSELTRVIECPYPASLVGLADLLARADIDTVRACIHSRPSCAVRKLATLICEALSLSAYPLCVLYYLSHSTKFRYELLHQNPRLLNDLLTKANSSQQDFENYAKLCVLLLSSPLPESLPLPAAAQSFFLRVFEKATQGLNADSLKSVYGMLNGACRQMFTFLSPDALKRFEEKLNQILSADNKVHVHSPMLMLWCFGIVLLAEHPEGIQDRQGQRFGLEQLTSTESMKRKWKTLSGRRLFGSADHSYNAINQTCLRVIWAIKGDVGVSDDTAIEGIRIASRTLRVIDRNVRKSYPKPGTPSEQNFQRLSEKIKRTAISRAVLFEALCSYAMIADGAELELETVARYEKCLIEAAQFADPDYLGETLAVSLPAFAPRIQEDTIRTLLDGILEACVTAPSAQQLSNLVILVNELATGISTSEPLRTKMLLALSANVIQEKLQTFVQTVTTNEGVDCSSYTMSLHRKLTSTTIALLLMTVLVAHTDQPALPHALTRALIEKQQQLPSVPHHCSHPSYMAERPSISLFQQECTPYTGQHLQDWRQRLKSELESQSFYQRDSIVRSVAQICQDLETRCNTVEEPLRREKERSKELEQRVAELCEQISSLESQATDDRLHLDGLEDEKLNIADEKDTIAGKLNELELEFAEANRQADETLRTAREEFDVEKLEFRSTILRFEESLSARNRELKELSGTLIQLKKDREKQEEYHHNLNKQHEHLRALLDDTEQKLADERETTTKQAEDVTQLQKRVFDLENVSQDTKRELAVINGQYSDLQVSHQALIQSSEEALRELEVKYSNATQAATIKAEMERNELHAQLQSTLQDNRRVIDAYEETQRENLLLRTSIPPLETRIQELVDVGSEQEEELNDLRNWRNKMQDLMGHPTKESLAIRQATRSHPEANDGLTTRALHEHRRRKLALLTQDIVPKTAMGAPGIANTTVEIMANTSFASSDSHSFQGGGSSPKRPKPRPSFKVPAMHTPYTQKPAITLRSVSKKLSPSKRSALRQMSPNRRHTSVGFAISEDEDELHSCKIRSTGKRRVSLQDIEQADLDMDNFVAGTPLTPGFMAGTGKAPEEDDGTVTEL